MLASVVFAIYQLVLLPGKHKSAGWLVAICGNQLTFKENVFSLFSNAETACS